MLAYLSQKIALPNQSKAICLSWSREHGFIACGGENGLLKVLKVESDHSQMQVSDNEVMSSPNTASATSSRNVSMNQTLEGHSGNVDHLAWNEKFEKLTSSDQSGLIIVWMFYKGSWYEEMVNNRNKSSVIGMKWTQDGYRIGIVYEDGSVIVGTVDGNRLWTKEIKNNHLTCIEWAPNGKYMLFGSTGGQIHCYDSNGNFLSKVTLGSNIKNKLLNSSNNINTTPLSSSIPKNINSKLQNVVTIKWYTSNHDSSYVSNMDALDGEQRHLAVAQENGWVYFMSNEIDEEPLIIESNMKKITSVEWNHMGTILAIAGECHEQDMIKQSSNHRLVVKFYCADNGNLIQMLTVPGHNLTACSWEKSGLRILLAVDTFIYFVQIRPDHLWTYFADTLVFSLKCNYWSNTILFCHLKKSKITTKSVYQLNALESFGQYCAMATNKQNQNLSFKANDASKSVNSDLIEEANRMKSSLYVCNSIGTSVDTVNVEYKINCLAMNSKRVFAAGSESFCIWRFRSPWSGYRTGNEAANVPMFADELTETEHQDEEQASGGFDRLFTVTLSHNDMISAICCSEKMLLVAQTSGTINLYHLPRATLAQRIQLNIQFPVKMKLNNNSNKLSILNMSRQLHVYVVEQLENSSFKPEVIKDVWDFVWSSDNNQWLTFIQKGKLFIKTISTSMLNGNVSVEQEPSLGNTQGYICQTANLQVTIALLDHFLVQLQKLHSKSADFEHYNNDNDQQQLNVNSFLVRFDSNLLKQTRELFEQQSLAEMTSFIEQRSHPRLWRLLAESALESLQLPAAELGFVRERDVFGVQLVKRISQLSNDRWKKAEVLLYFGKTNEAEQVYLQEGRIDLALEMWQMLGNWNRVWILLQEQGCADQNKLDQARFGLACDLQEQGQFKEAATHYACLGNLKQFVECCVLGQQFDRLVAAVQMALQTIGNNLPDEFDFGDLSEKKFGCTNEFVIDDHLSWPEDAAGWMELARLMQSLGECELAVQCYLAADQPQAAIDCCVRLNQWRLAIRLAAQQKSNQVRQLLIGYANELVAKKRWMEVVQLFVQANQNDAAFKIMLGVIEKAYQDNWSLIDMKKLYVLIGLLRTRSEGQSKYKLAHDLTGERPIQMNEISNSLNQTKSQTNYSKKSTQASSTAPSDLNSISKSASNRLQMLLSDLDEFEETKSLNVNETNSIVPETETQPNDPMPVNKLIENEELIGKCASDIVQQLKETTTQVDKDKHTDVMSQWLNQDNQSARAMLLKRDPWKGAEAYHFYLLAQTQLQEGYVDAAMHSALLLMDYEQFLCPLTIYSLIALTAAANRNMAVCSRAFIRLEALEQECLERKVNDQAHESDANDVDSIQFDSDTFSNQSIPNKNAFASLAVQLFSKQPPKQPKTSGIYECPLCENPLMEGGGGKCSKCDNRFATCVASGRPILENGTFWSCSVCNHQAFQADLVGFTCCPLCHHAIK